ncbi:hypothetical protein RJ639_031987 [Escallonia herrerae]|uniref:Uncharacterized protein n=1 Tax=Escallonia herrerae TaxID=1293975 RepID=A0AA88X5W5_9ASTE|nr:hypothetical protein RJ639_031987 [Escallonia herrerae]
MYALALVLVFLLAVLVEGLSHCTVNNPGSNGVASGFFQTGMYAVRAGLAYMVSTSMKDEHGYGSVEIGKTSF